MKRLVIFDLDGTLLNTIADLSAATNYALQTCGFPVHDIDSYRYFVGNGITKLIERALPEANRSKADIEKIVQEHKLELETLEKKHTQEIELLEKQYDRETKKGEEEIKNQLAANVITGMFSGLFSANSPIMEQLNETIVQSMKQSQNNSGE